MLFNRQLFALVVSVAAGALLTAPRSAQAVILSRTASRNTSAPTGTNYNSGWQWQGNWGGGFTGTPIAPNYFLTAAHIGGGVGQGIWLNGKTYTTVAQYDDPLTDLKIYKVSTPFCSYAPIYTGT